MTKTKNTRSRIIAVVATFVLSGVYSAVPGECTFGALVIGASCDATRSAYACNAAPSGCLPDGPGSTNCVIMLNEIPICGSPDPNAVFPDCPVCAAETEYDIGYTNFYAQPNCAGTPDGGDDYFDCGC